jgi:hypothetical protein
MANVSRPLGFIPIRHFDGSPYNGKLVACVIPASDGTAVFRGDVVVAAGNSYGAGHIIAGMDAEGLPFVTRATVGTTGQNIFGVVKDFLVDPTNLQLKYRLASTDRIALVCREPDVVYELQEDAVTTPIAPASIGLNAAFSLGAGNTATGNSTMQIVSTSVAVTATLPLKVLGLVKRVDNAFNTAGAGSDNAKFEVMFNTGAWMPNVAGN